MLTLERRQPHSGLRQHWLPRTFCQHRLHLVNRWRCPPAAYHFRTRNHHGLPSSVGLQESRRFLFTSHRGSRRTLSTPTDHTSSGTSRTRRQRRSASLGKTYSSACTRPSRRMRSQFSLSQMRSLSSATLGSRRTCGRPS